MTKITILQKLTTMISTILLPRQRLPQQPQCNQHGHHHQVRQFSSKKNLVQSKLKATPTANPFQILQQKEKSNDIDDDSNLSYSPSSSAGTLSSANSQVGKDKEKEQSTEKRAITILESENEEDKEETPILTYEENKIVEKAITDREVDQLDPNILAKWINSATTEIQISSTLLNAHADRVTTLLHTKHDELNAKMENKVREYAKSQVENKIGIFKSQVDNKIGILNKTALHHKNNLDTAVALTTTRNERLKVETKQWIDDFQRKV